MRKINYKLSTLNSQLSTPKGFTLIELLVVIAVLVFVGIFIGSILFSSLRGTNKTNTLTVVRQNGSFAISQTTKMLRNARSFEGVSIDGENYVTDCTQVIPPSPTPPPDPIKYTYLKITSFDDGQTIFSCSGSPLTLSSNSASLLDTTAVSIPVSNSCYFTCSQSTISDFPTIGINFFLREVVPTGALLPEKTASAAAIPFQTSVLMRNIGR
ncbi:MAG: hypothetical protein A3H79_00140 [Candidatus Levybacteria bacterium RIFCSPLOWO2_02_FULL_36_8b]|nr:MAG: hypothetical protein A3H79_00140 [Candidatus Levybacteria bacterium RIFCSPLOWO2_02_FULL_36_8b]